MSIDTVEAVCHAVCPINILENVQALRYFRCCRHKFVGAEYSSRLVYAQTLCLR